MDLTNTDSDKAFLHSLMRFGWCMRRVGLPGGKIVLALELFRPLIASCTLSQEKSSRTLEELMRAAPANLENAQLRSSLPITWPLCIRSTTNYQLTTPLITIGNTESHTLADSSFTTVFVERPNSQSWVSAGV